MSRSPKTTALHSSRVSTLASASACAHAIEPCTSSTNSSRSNANESFSAFRSCEGAASKRPPHMRSVTVGQLLHRDRRESLPSAELQTEQADEARGVGRVVAGHVERREILLIKRVLRFASDDDRAAFVQLQRDGSSHSLGNSIHECVITLAQRREPLTVVDQ